MPHNYYRDTEYGIGSSMATVQTLRKMGVPPPDQSVYKPASVYYVRGDNSRVGDGTPVVDWIWDVLSVEKLAILMDFLGGADYATVYINTDRKDGTYAMPGESFTTFSATMWKPILSGNEGVGVARSPYAYQTVRIRFVDIEAVGDYL